MNALLEAERALLGALIQNPDRMDDLYIQAPEMYADERHNLILKTLIHSYEVDETIDLVMMAQRSSENLAKIGGISYLYLLSDSVPSVDHFEHYQKIIREEYIQRESAEVYRMMYEASKAGGDEGKKRIGECEARLEELADLANAKRSSGVVDMSELLVGHTEEINQRKANKGMMGSKTLSRELDKLTGGHRREDLEVVAARPSMGKTAYMICDAIESKKDGMTPLILSAEMPKKQILERLICALANLDNNKMKSGMFDPGDWERYDFAAAIIEEKGYLIDDEPGMSIPYIRSTVKKLIKKYPNLIVYVDYLQLIKGGRSFGSEREELDYVSRSLKLLARKYGITVVALAQLSRKVEERQDKRPMMSDIKGAGGIEQDADIITFLYRDDYYNKGSEAKDIVELIIAKGRNVGIGTVEMVFRKSVGKFIDLDRSHHGKTSTAS